MKSAGFLVFLRRRNPVKPLEEVQQGGTFGGGVGGSGSGRKEGGRCNSSLSCRSGVLQGGGGGRRYTDRGLMGWRGRNLREFENDCFCWTQRTQQGFLVDVHRLRHGNDGYNKGD